MYWVWILIAIGLVVVLAGVVVVILVLVRRRRQLRGSPKPVKADGSDAPAGDGPNIYSLYEKADIPAPKKTPRPDEGEKKVVAQAPDEKKKEEASSSATGSA